jgi:hypothetical protein
LDFAYELPTYAGTADAAIANARARVIFVNIVILLQEAKAASAD